MIGDLLDILFLKTKTFIGVKVLDKLDIGILGLIGLALTKDGVYVMEKLVGASDHDNLVGFALFSFLS